MPFPKGIPGLISGGAGSSQRFDLEDGTCLIPLYANESPGDPSRYMSLVARCAFDGEKLSYIEHGDFIKINQERGFPEPSLTRFQGRYFITLRNDLKGYVATSSDGLRFDTPKPWLFDDGSELGNYNTQQHWVTHEKGLFLVYTRRGLDNDHIFRHHAPLMIAQVDPDRLAVIRETERELVPNRGARLGNFSVCEVSKDETWVTVSEWMQPIGCERYGSDNSIWAARILWDSPNSLVK